MRPDSHTEISTKSAITGSSESTLALREQLDHSRHFSIAGSRHLSGISVSTYRRDAYGLGLTLPTPVANAYLNIVQLRTVGPTQFIRGDGLNVRTPLGANGLQILDMRDSWRVDLRNPFHSVDFALTQSAISDFAREVGARGQPELIGSVTEQSKDDVMENFAKLMLPALEKPQEANALFFGHLFSAARIHLIRKYGVLQFVGGSISGKLAPWQERRALDFLRNDLTRDITIEALSAECNLSPTHFTRAFKATTGKPPHQWRLSYRIEQVKNALRNTDDPICDIATACGFADQSHLTRVFSRAVGTSPAAWRRHK